VAARNGADARAIGGTEGRGRDGLRSSAVSGVEPLFEYVGL